MFLVMDYAKNNDTLVHKMSDNTDNMEVLKQLKNKSRVVSFWNSTGS